MSKADQLELDRYLDELSVLVDQVRHASEELVILVDRASQTIPYTKESLNGTQQS